MVYMNFTRKVMAILTLKSKFKDEVWYQVGKEYVTWILCMIIDACFILYLEHQALASFFSFEQRWFYLLSCGLYLIIFYWLSDRDSPFKWVMSSSIEANGFTKATFVKKLFLHSNPLKAIVIIINLFFLHKLLVDTGIWKPLILFIEQTILN